MSAPTLLLLARQGDPAIELLRRSSLPQQLVHVAVADLSTPGWHCETGRPERAKASAGGRVLGTAQIAAVVCRIHCITATDLAHLHAEDREFAAGEMQAFLRAWLSQLGERVCNEPGSSSLAGPVWLPPGWRWLATRLGIPALPAHSFAAEKEECTVLVAGNRVLGTGDATLQRYASDLARTVRARLLSVRFVRLDDWRLADADACPVLDDASVAALLDWALPRGAARRASAP